MIKVMEDYRNELENYLYKNCDDVELVPYDVATLNLEPVHSPSRGGPVNFSDCKTAMMMMRVDSATTTESGSDCSVVAVREAARSISGEVIVVEESRNLIVVAVGPNTSESSGTAVKQLLALVKQVISKVLTCEFTIHIRIRLSSYSLNFILSFVWYVVGCPMFGCGFRYEKVR